MKKVILLTMVYLIFYQQVGFSDVNPISVQIDKFIELSSENDKVFEKNQRIYNKNFLLSDELALYILE